MFQIIGATIAFEENLNRKGFEATRRLQESMQEFPPMTWNDVTNSVPRFE